jgi:hypothetical protein
MTRTWRLSGPVVLLLAVIAVLVLADIGIVALRLSSGHPIGSAPSARSAPTAPGHPCNHGAYVSAAAHAHKGGGYVSSIAKGKLGKNGNCSAPLPAAPAAPAASGGDD